MTSDILEVLVFVIGNQSFGVDVAKVVEAIRAPDILYKSENGFSRRFLNYKNTEIPFIDMARDIYSDFSVSPEERESVIVNIENRMAAFDVDSVKEFIDLPIESIDTLPDFIHKRIYVDFIWGIGKAGDEIIFLVDFDRFLDDTEKSGLPDIGLIYK